MAPELHAPLANHEFLLILWCWYVYLYLIMGLFFALLLGKVSFRGGTISPCIVTA